MTGPDNHETRPISVAELLARNGNIGSPPPVGGRRRRRRGNTDAVTVAELTGEIPIIGDEDDGDEGDDGDEDEGGEAEAPGGDERHRRDSRRGCGRLGQVGRIGRGDASRPGLRRSRRR